MDFASFFNAVKPPYEIEQSIRLNESDSAHFYRNQGSDGNRKTFTISFWTKITDMTTDFNYAFYSNRDASSSVDGEIYINSQNRMLFYTRISGDDRGFAPSMLFRDPSAWYHVVLEVDTTDSTADDRMKVWVNGVRQTDKALNWDNPTSSQDLGFNRSGSTFIGRGGASPEYGDFYLAEYHFVDGTALDCTSFGEFNSNGVWIPKAYNGSHGTQGFYLKFDPNAANGIGHDHSDNSNNWTAYNFVTSGTGTDVMSDTPTKNFCTWNPLDNAGVTISNGNLDTSSGSSGVCTGTIAVSSGKHYWEYSNITTGTGTPFIMGLCQAAGLEPNGHSNHKRAALFYTDGSGNGNVWRYENGSVATTITVPSSIRRFYPQDVLNVVYDADAGKVWFGKNDQYLDSSGGFTGDPVAGSNATVTFPDSNIPMTPVRDHAGVAISATANFGQRNFDSTLGTVGATDYFNTVTYTANNQSSLSVTGVGFQPDLVWLKTRGRNEHHYLYDAVRGVGNRISTSQTIAEVTGDNTFTSFDSDGFTLGSDGAGIANYQTDSMVAWCWKAGGTGSANNSGSLNATVSASQDAGFSIVTYTGNSTSGATFAHGLGTAPSVVIVKNIDSGSQGWMIYHSGMGATKAIQFTASGELTDTAYWNDTAPSSTLVTLGNDNATNASGDDYVAYCWAEKSGVSKFGSYTGDGSNDGPVISCGFRPAMVMIKWYKDVSTSESWHIYDNKRAGNPTNTILQPDSNADDESPSDRYIQFTEDGFQLRSSGQQINRSGAKYIFMAFAGTFTASDTYKSLNTANLAAPTVKDGSKYMNTVLYTGDAVNGRTVTGLDFAPDFLWLKKRNSADRNILTDVVRGATNTLNSDDARSEASATESNQVQAFTSGGFTIGSNSNVNGTNDTFVAWAWDAGGSVSADNNTDGSVPSTVSANPTAGFSVITYEANGTAGMNFGHGLGVAPGFVICKNRDDVNPWIVWHKDLPETNYLLLDVKNKQQTQSDWITTSSSTITWDSLSGSTTTNGSDYLVLAFAEVDGYSKFGKYRGNGSSDGPFIYTGFRPAFILFKNYANGAEQSWTILDNTRDTYNPVQKTIYPDIPNGEDGTVSNVDFCSNGFKLRNAWQNESGSDHIYVAFAENPFGGDGVSPATAR